MADFRDADFYDPDFFERDSFGPFTPIPGITPRTSDFEPGVVMANVDYPEFLPDFLLSGNSVEQLPTNIRTEFDYGNFEQTLIRPGAPEMHDLEVLMNMQQFEVFEYFYINVVDAGSIAFNAPVRSATGCVIREVRIPRKYSYTWIDDKHALINIRIELLRKPTMSKADYDRIVNPQIFRDFYDPDFFNDDFYEES